MPRDGDSFDRDSNYSSAWIVLLTKWCMSRLLQNTLREWLWAATVIIQSQPMQPCSPQDWLPRILQFTLGNKWGEHKLLTCNQTEKSKRDKHLFKYCNLTLFRIDRSRECMQYRYFGILDPIQELIVDRGFGIVFYVFSSFRLFVFSSFHPFR